MKKRLQKKLSLLLDLINEDRGDEVFEKGLDYLLSYEEMKLEDELGLTTQQIQQYEREYEMESRDFLRFYEAGELEDQPEFLEWFALLSLEVILKKRLTMVSSAIAAE